MLFRNSYLPDRIFLQDDGSAMVFLTLPGTSLAAFPALATIRISLYFSLKKESNKRHRKVYGLYPDDQLAFEIFAPFPPL